MMWRTVTTLAASSLIFPLYVYAAQPNLETNTWEDNSQPTMMNQIAQRAKHGKRYGRGGGMKQLFQQLDLTSEQSEQIEVIHEQYHAETETLRQELQPLHQELRSLLASDASPEQLRQQHQQIQNLHRQLGNNRFESMLEVREILTSEQRTQLAELMEQFQGRRGGGFNR